MYENFIYNFEHYKTIARGDNEKKLPDEIRESILGENSDSLKTQVKREINIQKPIINLIDAAQSKTCNLATIAEYWFKLEDEMPLNCPSTVKQHVATRKEQALCPVTLLAYFFDPKKDVTILTISHKWAIERCFNQRVREFSARKSFTEYKEKRANFVDFDIKDMDAKTFWQSIRFEYPELSKVAIQALSIPASSAEIERVFSKWREVHTPLRNRLGAEKSEKLLSAYYHLSQLRLKKANKNNIPPDNETPEELEECDQSIDEELNVDFVADIL